MISIIAYIIKLLLNLFVTTILVTDVTSNKNNDGKNLKLILFCSFFTLTLASVSSLISIMDKSILYSTTLLVIFFIVNSLVINFDIDEKLKIYLICLCSFLFGIGGIILTLIGIISSVISYIILYNSTDFYKFFFSNVEKDNIDKTDFDENHTI